MAKSASFAELVSEATELASQVAMLEEEVMDSFDRTGRIITAYNKRERRANIAAVFVPRPHHTPANLACLPATPNPRSSQQDLHRDGLQHASLTWQHV